MHALNPLNVVGTVLITFWWFVPLLIIIGLLKSPQVKGFIGELVVRALGHLMLDKNVYHRIDNLILPTPDGTTQIDHVFVSCYGLFVVETKNMNGWIFGSEAQPTWTQQLYRKKSTFQNPLRQNYKHLKALESVLQVPSSTLHSVVTFVGRSTFKTPMPKNVTRGTEYTSYIKSFRVPVFSNQQVNEFVQQLKSARFTTTHAKHRAHVQTLKKRAEPDAEHLCPKCGGAMVLRTAKAKVTGGQQFWGCSNYPRCRMTQPLGG